MNYKLKLVCILFVIVAFFMFSIVGCDQSEVNMLKGQVSKLKSEKLALERDVGLLGEEVAVLEGGVGLLQDEVASSGEQLADCRDRSKNLSDAEAYLAQLRENGKGFLKITNQSSDWIIMGVHVIETVEFTLGVPKFFSENLLPDDGHVIRQGESMVFHLDISSYEVQLQWYATNNFNHRTTTFHDDINITWGKVEHLILN